MVNQVPAFSSSRRVIGYMQSSQCRIGFESVTEKAHDDVAQVFNFETVGFANFEPSDMDLLGVMSEQGNRRSREDACVNT
jgi:hypothetical protein